MSPELDLKLMKKIMDTVNKNWSEMSSHSRKWVQDRIAAMDLEDDEAGPRAVESSP